jgi:hypothetical protein
VHAHLARDVVGGRRKQNRRGERRGGEDANRLFDQSSRSESLFLNFCTRLPVSTSAV